jgi:hypothetical protein
MASQKEIAIALLSTTELDVQSAAQTTLYTVPAGKRLVIDHVKVVCGSAASTTAGLSFGQSTALTDFQAEQTMTNLAAQYDAVKCMPVTHATVPLKIKSYAAGAIIQCDVVTADVDGATDCKVLLFGTLYDA